MAVVVNLWFGDPEVGLWCPKCLLPSGFRVPIYSVTDLGVGIFGHIEKCYDCGAPINGDAS